MTSYKHRLIPWFWGLCAWLGLCMSLGLVQAQDHAAGVTLFAEGQVTAQSRQQDPRNLSQSDPIYEHDQITTHNEARAQLRFTDGGLVSLMPDSRFVVEEYLYQETQEQGSLVFGLLKGGLRTVTGAIGKQQHEQYELKTPVATLGIRGTEYIAVLNPPNTLRVHVGRGKVVLTNDHGELEVPQGQSAIAVQGQAPAISDEAPEFLAAQPQWSDDQPQFTDFQDQFIADPLRDFPEINPDQLQLLGGTDPELIPLPPITPDPGDPDPGLEPSLPDDPEPGGFDPENPWISPGDPGFDPEDPGFIEYCESIGYDANICGW